MKKYLSVVFAIALVFVFTGCNSEKQDDLTMDKFIEAFNNSGEDVHTGVNDDKKAGVDAEEKPLFALIKAKNGVIFDIGRNVVKILRV